MKPPRRELFPNFVPGRKMRLHLACVLTLVGLMAGPEKSWALGVRIPNQDASAIGRGNAFVATADNPSAIYYNPAGITQLEGFNVQVGSLFYLGIDAEHKSALTGDTIQNDDEVIPVPAVHLTYKLDSIPLAFGLGVYAPFGLAMEWPDDATFTTGGRQGELNYITLNPVVALQPIPTLSLAVGPTVSYTDLELSQGLSPFVPGSEFKFDGDEYVYGFNAGARWQPMEQLAFGVSYRSSTRAEYDGEVELNPAPPFPGAVDTKALIDFPQIIIFGVSWRPTPKWNVEVNADWTDWDTTDQLRFEGVTSLTLNWQSSWFYEAGVTRYFGSGFYASVGYFFSENSTTDENYTPTVPDTDLHVGSLGVGRRGEHWNWALAGQIIAGPWEEVNNNVNPTVNGDYKLFIPTVSFTVGYHF